MKNILATLFGGTRHSESKDRGEDRKYWRSASDRISPLLQILTAIANPPNRHKSRLPTDINGDFDEWFDGGAFRIVTGYTTYVFANGSRAVVHTLPYLLITVTMPGGETVKIVEGGK